MTQLDLKTLQALAAAPEPQLADTLLAAMGPGSADERWANAMRLVHRALDLVPPAGDERLSAAAGAQRIVEFALAARAAGDWAALRANAEALLGHCRESRAGLAQVEAIAAKAEVTLRRPVTTPPLAGTLNLLLGALVAVLGPALAAAQETPRG